MHITLNQQRMGTFTLDANDGTVDASFDVAGPDAVDGRFLVVQRWTGIRFSQPIQEAQKYSRS